MTDENLCCATTMRKASRRLTQIYDTALGEVGLRSTQYAILAELRRAAKRPPTLQELADTLVMDRSGLGHTLRPLEREGLVAFADSDEDRRRRHIVLTPEGLEKAREGRRCWQRAQAHLHDVVGTKELASLNRMLLAIAHHDELDCARSA